MDLHALRLAYVCENAAAIRDALADRHAAVHFERLTGGDADAAEALRAIGELLELDGLPGWDGTGSRAGMADVAGLPQAVARARLVCPRSGAGRCARTGLWEPRRERPACALAGRELRWDGDVSLDG